MASRRFPSEVPERVVRLVALQVAVIGTWAVAFASPVPALLLVLDFGMRALVSPRFSPLALVARQVAPLLPGGAGDPVLYAPKRFAATLGMVFFGAAFALLLVPGAETAGRVIAGTVVGLASLEAFAGVCVGCTIHSLLVRFGLLRAPVCENCVPATVRVPR